MPPKAREPYQMTKRDLRSPLQGLHHALMTSQAKSVPSGQIPEGTEIQSSN